MLPETLKVTTIGFIYVWQAVTVFLSAIYGVLLASDWKTRVSFFVRVRNCIAQGHCPNGHNWWHEMSDRAAWAIMSAKKPGWRVAPAAFAESYLNFLGKTWLFVPIGVLGALLFSLARMT